MSGVDVLAVMDRAAGGLYPINSDGSLEVLAARAAVAELIGAVDAYQKAKDAAISNPALDGEYQDAESRLDDALARCQPAALSQPATQQGDVDG